MDGADRGGLLDLLLERVEQSSLPEVAQLLVLAAYEGDDELAQALEGAVQGSKARPAKRAGSEVPHAYLKAVEVELELGEQWRKLQPEVASAPMRAQLLLLPTYVDRAVAQEAIEAWYGLSRGTNHHAYELAPTAAELRDWLKTVERVRVGLSAQPLVDA